MNQAHINCGKLVEVVAGPGIEPGTLNELEDSSYTFAFSYEFLLVFAKLGIPRHTGKRYFLINSHWQALVYF